MSARIEKSGSELLLVSPRDYAFIEAMKREIGPGSRRWDSERKVWLFTADVERELVAVVTRYFGAPRITNHSDKIGQNFYGGILRVEYIGGCKPRMSGGGLGSSSAFAWYKEGWNAIFPEQVLRDWFKSGPAPKAGPAAPQTLYEVLCVAPTAPPHEIKSSYRRLARVLHPDVNGEPDAHESFLRLQRAWETLSEPLQRRKYDAGLWLQNSVKVAPRSNVRDFEALERWYKCPLRCGQIGVEGEKRLGRIHVSRIVSWTDIVNLHGKILVTSWPAGAERFETRWVESGDGLEVVF